MNFTHDIEVEFKESMGQDSTIIEVARQSTTGAFRGWPEDEKLLRFLYEHAHCYDEQTEVLVKGKGFIRWSQVMKDDMLGQWDQESDSLVYEKAKALIVKEYEGEMYRVDHAGVDLLVTPDHKMLVKRKVADLDPNTHTKQKWSDEWSLVKAKDLGDKTMIRYRKHAAYRVKPRFSGEGFPDVDCYLSLLKLVGFFVGDGHAGGTDTNAISFHLKKKRKIEYLEGLALAVGWELRARAGNNWAVRAPHIGKTFREMFYDPDDKKKRIPEQLLDLNQEEAAAVLDGLRNSDGTQHRSTWKYSSVSGQVVEALQRLALHAGEVVQINKKQKTIHQCGVMAHMREPVINQTWCVTSWERYKGKVYCAHTRTGVLVVRRNKKVVLSGNSTPQEFCVLHVECRVPVFVARQVMRHRTLTFSEMSGRYVEIPERAYHPLEWKEQSTKNKQASAGPIEEQLQADAIYEGLITESVATYKQLLAMGISREQARMVLPLSMMTQFRVIGNLRNWFHFLGLRLDKHAQDETRVMAQQVADIIAERWPRSWALFEEKVLK